jgi:uncharacterized membrane protein YgdD (TMEM256/DUF423 family)
VGLGAMAAHALKTRIAPDMLLIFETGARYHIYHALGLLVLAAFIDRGVGLQGASWCLMAGIGLFSGSLYVLALSGQRWLGMVTPLGGLAFISGWVWAALALWRSR